MAQLFSLDHFEYMNKYESTLLSQWPRHRSRGMAIFILCRGILVITVPFAGTFWLFRFFVFHHHTAHWDDIVYSLGVGLVLGVFKGAFLWHKMERLYGDLQKQNDHVV